jgi:hypothetical protein
MFGLWKSNTSSNMACCADPEIPLEDDYSAAGTQVSTDLSDESGESQLRTPYQKATPLFRGIENEDWEGVHRFLNTSKWSNSFFVSSANHMANPTPQIQCKTWVTAYDDHGREEWSQLPLHAAISYGAPAVVIQKLIDLYPDALKKRDKEGMLPIHLAFGFSAPDPVLSLLLKAYPESVQQKGPGGRLPHECCELGPNKMRGEVYCFLTEQTAVAVEQEFEATWKKCVQVNTARLQLGKDDKLEEKQLTELLTELLEDRKQLRDLKQKLKGKFGSSETKAPVTATAVETFPSSINVAIKGIPGSKSLNDTPSRSQSNKHLFKTTATSHPSSPPNDEPILGTPKSIVSTTNHSIVSIASRKSANTTSPRSVKSSRNATSPRSVKSGGNPVNVSSPKSTAKNTTIRSSPNSPSTKNSKARWRKKFI